MLEKKKKKRSFEGLQYSYEGIAKENPLEAPKPDPFFWHGSLVEGTGCFFPGTKILVPGTGVFKQRNSDKLYIACGFKITRPGYYRIITFPHWDNNFILNPAIWEFYTTEFHNKQLEPFLKKRKSKNRYARRMARVKNHQLKKSQIRLTKQTARDSKDFKMSNGNIEALLEEAKATEKHRVDSETGRIMKAEGLSKKEAKKKAIAKFAKESFQYNKADATLAALAKCHNTTPHSVFKVRTEIQHTESMIAARKMWERGRKKKLKPRRKFWEWVYVPAEIDAREEAISQLLGGHYTFHTPKGQWKRKAKFNYDGGYARAGDPKKIDGYLDSPEALKEKIKAFKAQERKKILATPQHQQASTSLTPNNPGLTVPTATTRPESHGTLIM